MLPSAALEPSNEYLQFPSYRTGAWRLLLNSEIHLVSSTIMRCMKIKSNRNYVLYKTRSVVENRAVHATWENTVQPDRPQMRVRRMSIACWIPKATDTQSEYVIHVAFQLQQWLHKRASMLRYTYITCPCYLKCKRNH
jgi:hypothetical protein